MLSRLALLSLVACARPAGEYRCERSTQCIEEGAAGFCEASGLCSFVDPGCETGRRYGPLAGEALAAQCVPLPRCGDGVVREVVEECDDGNDDDQDGCTRACVTCNDEADARFTWSENGHCYTRHEVATDWYAAASACEELGAYLSAHETEVENGAVSGALGEGGPAWFGLLSATTWITEEPVQYARWAAGCPGVGTTFAFDASGDWCDHEEPLPYVCEHAPQWLVRPSDGHAYHTGPERVTRAVAEAECATLGAHLAIIETSDEGVFLAPMVFYYDWLGAEATATDGIYQWSTGQPLDYANWDYDEPNGGADTCVVMYASGAWRDVPCDDTNYPLCEREL